MRLGGDDQPGGTRGCAVRGSLLLPLLLGALLGVLLGVLLPDDPEDPADEPELLLGVRSEAVLPVLAGVLEPRV